jgi:mRNA-degrading endonuclease RelE of RelBE toxin-antitoxin system
LKKVSDQNTLDKVYDVIENIKSSNSLHQVKNIKKLQGYPNAFRIRLGDFRLGLFCENDTVIFVRLLSRKDMYNKFP